MWLLLQYTLFAYVAAALLFAMAALTDFYDGHLAKRQGITSDFGKMMDPIADKVLILSIFAVFAHMGLIELWMVLIIAVREITVTISRLQAMLQGQILAAEKAGKIKTVLQIVTVSVILSFLIAEESPFTVGWFFQIQPFWQGSINFFMVATVVVTIASGIVYFRNLWTSSPKQ